MPYEIDALFDAVEQANRAEINRRARENYLRRKGGKVGFEGQTFACDTCAGVFPRRNARHFRCDTCRMPKKTILCGDCGCVTPCKNAGRKKFCDRCSLARERATQRECATRLARKRGVIPKGIAVTRSATCQRCSVDFTWSAQKGGGVKRFCDGCLRDRHNERVRARHWRRRRQAGTKAIGDDVPCKMCRVPFVLTQGFQKYCEPCRQDRTALSKIYTRRYRVRNLERINLQDRYRVKHDPQYALRKRLGAAIRKSLREGKMGRSTFELLGYRADELRSHIERQFKGRMSWKNMGKWHIDHVVPLSSFKYESPDDPDFKAAWALSNLRPLWAKENLSKNAKRTHLL